MMQGCITIRSFHCEFVIIQEVVVQGQDKVYKDVIEPLESVSVNTIPTSKQDIRELGPPDQVLFS